MCVSSTYSFSEVAFVCFSLAPSPHWPPITPTLLRSTQGVLLLGYHLIQTQHEFMRFSISGVSISVP